MAGQRVSIVTTLSILILLLASFTPIVSEYEEISELESLDYRYDSSTSDRKAWEWLKVGGSVDTDSIGEMIVLPNGGAIISGSFDSSVTIDSCTANMAPNSNSGFASVFVAKIDKNGSCEWINTVSGSQSTPRMIGDGYSQISVVVDANQSVYLYSAAENGGLYYFDNISVIISSSNMGYIAKLSSNGSWEWASSLYSINAEASIVLKSNGELLVASGHVIVSFDQSGQTQNEYVFSPSSGVFQINDLELDQSGNIYLGGYFSGYLTININGTDMYYNSATMRLFALKIDSNGNYEWFSTASYPTSSSMVRSISFDGNNSMYVSGYFYGNLELGSTSLSTGGTQRGFVAEINSTGGWANAIKINSASSSIANDILPTTDGGFLVTGEFQGTLSMGPVELNPSGGQKEIFLLKFNHSASTEWGLGGGSNENDGGWHIGNDSAGNIYLSGESDGNLVLGGESAVGLGGVDVFLAKVSPDYDGDGVPDVDDNDVDNDFVLNAVDRCLFSPLGFQSITSFDHDRDGCEDFSEDLDDDDDGMEDYSDSCAKGLTGWISNTTNDVDSDGCMDALEDLDDDDDGFEDYEDLCPREVGNSSYVYEMGCIDSDGDTRPDIRDPFPNNDSEWSDLDFDGIGDNADAFDLDPTQNSDRDGDGWGDNLGGRLADLFPDNPTQWEDADGDGLGDNQSGTEPDPHLFDFDNDGFIDAIDILPKFASPGDLDADGCMDEGLNPDLFPEDPTECFDFDGDGLGDNEDTDDDGDGWSDAVEEREGTDSRDVLSKPVEPFEIVVPGTTVGLGAWDLIGMMGGIPLFIWIAFGFITRNNRTARFEERLRNATSRDELEEIALDSEYALMLRLIGPHQGIRLERLRVELDDMFEARKQQLSSIEPMPENQTHLVEEEIHNEVKSREF